jgi:DNA-directed RNA polymerase beta subunit
MQEFNQKKINLISSTVDKNENTRIFIFQDYKQAGTKLSEYKIVLSPQSTDANLLFTFFYINSDRLLFASIPKMTPQGTFVINGNEKVVVSQLVRSSGIYYKTEFDLKNKYRIFSCDLIPARGL